MITERLRPEIDEIFPPEEYNVVLTGTSVVFLKGSSYMVRNLLTSLLLVLQGWKLLKYHQVGDPRYRGNVIALQTPHNTAVLVDRASRTEWVVDLWTRGYGQKPDVIPVAKWLKED